MSWLLSILVGAITAVLGGILTGFVASLAVDWYNVPSREGASGYFVIMLILLALIVGMVIGLVVSRQVAARPDPGFFKSLGLSLAIGLGLIGGIGGIARLLADVGPTIDGKKLLVNVELQWPPGLEPEPAPPEGMWVRLSSSSGRVVRVSESGPMWREDARLEEGRWVVPGAVDLFTSRGERSITFEPEGTTPVGYLLPLSAWPGRKYLQWSPWLPRQKSGGPPVSTEQFRYRFRLVKSDQPIRTEKFGDFEVSSAIGWISEVTWADRPRTWSAHTDFSVRYRGQPVSLEVPGEDSTTTVKVDTVPAVALIPGPQPALLLRAKGRQDGQIWLVTPQGDSLRKEYLADGSSWSTLPPITNDTAVFRKAAHSMSPEGRVDRTSFETPGLYLFDKAILDTRDRTIRRTDFPVIWNVVDRIPPLALSPDQKSYVRVAHDPDSSSVEVLEVFNLSNNQRYRLPIDRHKLRYGTIDDLDPAFVTRYFKWEKGSDGSEQLVARSDVKPLPYRGRLSFSEPSYREYRVYLARESLRTAMIDWLVAEFKGERVPVEEDRYSQRVTIDGKTIYLSWSEDDEHVGVWMDRGSDTALILTIAERFDKALATGQFDQHFVQ